MERKTLIRLLVAVAIGVPLLVEAATFAGLVGQQFGDDVAASTTTTTTPGGRTVGVGDDLLAGTAQVERVTAATVYAGDEWRFVLEIRVRNTGDRPYALRVGPLRTQAGESVAGAFTTRRLAPGETATLTARWTLPSGSSPAAVTATAFAYGANDTDVTTETVRLGSVPVQYESGS